MQTPANIAVIPRDLHFRTESARGAAWLGGDPVATAVFNALSLTFPDGERMFIESVRAFRSGLQGKLAEDARAFIAQEAIHSREHASLNAHLDRRHYPVERIEGSVRRRLAFLRKLGPMRMLGVTIALEHFTAMLADLFDSDPQLWNGTPEEILRLWRWHAMEETEHKAVAFDASGRRRGATCFVRTSWCSPACTSPSTSSASPGRCSRRMVRGAGGRAGR
jgi:predicted metal-dependent hydrolase